MLPKNSCENHISGLTTLILIITLGLFLYEVESLKCYKCLNFDCPEDDRGEKNEKLCQSARSFIVKAMSPYYEFGPIGYIGPCPSLDETLQWTLLQHLPEECPSIRESATCSLGRLQVITEENSNTIISHATILGCMKPALLNYMKTYTGNKQICSIFEKNNTEDASSFLHKLQLENCPKASDYCHVKNFCIPYSESIVKSYQTNSKNKSFEAGLIIAIISVIVVIIVVALLASFCKYPLSRSTNYSLAQVQVQDVRVRRNEPSQILSSSKDNL